ncbi:MAG: BsuBI/PstI family type II restriction endonuclease [Beijerinckiaceae bacterium]
MATVDEARQVLKALRLPKAQTNNPSAYVLLALCGLKPTDPWSAATREARTITKGLRDFMAEHHGKAYAWGSRETIRRKSIHQFIQAVVADMNPFGNKATNSQDFHYAVTEVALTAIRAFGTADWDVRLAEFHAAQALLAAVDRSVDMVPVQFPDGTVIKLSYGEHNNLQRVIVEDFAGRFAQGASVLYIGDTAKKDLFIAVEKIEEIGIELTSHDKLPDVMLYHEEKNWLYLVEAVISHGPMSQKRLTELAPMLKGCSAGRIFVSAFPDMKRFKKYAPDIAWETEVWLAEKPDHLIHFNGDRFFGPREK